MAEQTPEQVAAAQEASQKAMAEMVQGAVKNTIEAMVKDSQTKAAAAAEEKAAADAAAAAGARQSTGLDEMFRPALEPALKAARDAETISRLAADSVNFYTDPANAQALKYRPQIEKVVTEQAKKGNIVARTDAWKYLRGGDLYDELGKEALTSHETKLKEAREASGAGPSTAVPKFSKPIDDMKTDELGEALKGVTF